MDDVNLAERCIPRNLVTRRGGSPQDDEASGSLVLESIGVLGLWGYFLAGLLVGLGSSLACPVCAPTPLPSIVESLWSADVVVLARREGEALRISSVIKGKKEDDIEKSESARDLGKGVIEAWSNAEQSAVLAARSKERTWRLLGWADESFAVLVREIVRFTARWKTAPRERLEYFAARLDHENAQVRSAAHGDIARASYPEIKRVAGLIARDWVHAKLRDRNQSEWHALYLLLLAQSDAPEDHAYISKRLHNASALGHADALGALVTAVMERHEERGLEIIENLYMGQTDRTEKEMIEVRRALSVHGSNGHRHLRDRIVVRAYEWILKHYPPLTPVVVEDLARWGRTEYRDRIAEFEDRHRQSLDLSTSLRLRQYVRMAVSTPR